MRFLRNLFLAVLCVVLTASAILFAATYTVLSVAGPSLFMALIDSAGGTEKVVSQALEYSVPYFSEDPEFRDALAKSAQAAIKPEIVRDLVGDAISGIKRFFASNGQDTAILLDLRPLKANLLKEFKKNLPSAVDFVEQGMEAIPDRPNLAGPGILDSLRNAVRPVRIFSNLPAAAAATALACLALMLLILGWRTGGLRLAGSCLLSGGIIVLAAVTFASSGPIDKNILRLLPAAAPDFFPIAVEPRALAGAAISFVLNRLRMVSAGCLAVGVAFILIPRRKAAVTRGPTG